LRAPPTRTTRPPQRAMVTDVGRVGRFPAGSWPPVGHWNVDAIALPRWRPTHHNAALVCYSTFVLAIQGPCVRSERVAAAHHDAHCRDLHPHPAVERRARPADQQYGVVVPLTARAVACHGVRRRASDTVRACGAALGGCHGTLEPAGPG